MLRRPVRRTMWRGGLTALAIVPALAVAAGPTTRPERPEGVRREDAPRWLLPPATAVGIQIDTFLIGGYASGRFADAVLALSSELNAEERRLVGQHLDRIFLRGSASDGLGAAGRLRLAYERALRPDGTTRSIRVLGAEVAVGGRLHTALYFERPDGPGYFDSLGRPLSGEDWAGPLRSYRVSSPFAARRMHPVLGRVLPHTGVDLAAPLGEPVRATATGIVSIAGPEGGYGLLVELRHADGYSTRYAHLSKIAPSLEISAVVERGDVIGYVGMTGLATGPHLHYEVRRRGQPMDPNRLDRVDQESSAADTDPRWPDERRAIERLLARAPTVVRPNPRTEPRDDA